MTVRLCLPFAICFVVRLAVWFLWVHILIQPPDVTDAPAFSSPSLTLARLETHDDYDLRSLPHALLSSRILVRLDHLPIQG